jgi:hypothetical protein
VLFQFCLKLNKITAASHEKLQVSLLVEVTELGISSWGIHQPFRKVTGQILAIVQEFLYCV